MAEIDEVLASRVRALRKERGFSQEVLSRRAGLNDKYVGQLERGEHRATVGAAEDLSRALGVTLPTLLGGPEGPGASSLLEATTIRKPRQRGYTADTAGATLLRVVARLRERREEELQLVERLLDALFDEPGPRPRRIHR
jgi:transcriptional regulator with XRE-family HTH domain